MDISCDIIRDLLPLYAEDLVSEDSRNLVNEHLCSCDLCTKQLGILKKAAQLPIEVEIKSLKRVGDTIRRRRIMTVVTALLTVLTIVVSGFIFMLTPVFLTAEQAIEGVELREDGGLAIDYASGITGRSSYALNEDITHRGIMCHTTRYDWFDTKLWEQEWKNLSRDELEAYILNKYEAEEMTQRLWDRFHNISVEYGTFALLDGTYLHTYDPEVWVEGNGEWTFKESEITQWYLDIHTGAPKDLLWDGTKQEVGDTWIEPFYGYSILFVGGIILAAASFFLSRRTQNWKQELLIQLAILCVSISFSALLVTGGNIVVGEAWSHEWKDPLFTEAVCVTLTLLFWHRLHKLNKQAKGL